ncbi:hypothetical protein AX15_000363 [Amanita polypyramis BW_CC]|nr:hypothetical protein AX15_000363 [Amanita polypyramis BW_CC]
MRHASPGATTCHLGIRTCSQGKDNTRCASQPDHIPPKACQLRVLAKYSLIRRRMDILDDPGSSKVIATFELPGVKSDQITLNLHQQVLYICGRRVPRTLRECLVDPSTETVNQGTVPSGSNFSIDPTKYLRQELRYGPFKREIRLPHGIREGDIMASLRDGLLTVTWPRHSGSTLDAEPLNSATEDERKHAIATSTEED